MNIQIGLSRSESFISKAIRWFGKRKTGAASYSHAFLKIEDLVIEEHGKLRIIPYKRYDKITHVLYQPTFLTDDQVKEIKQMAFTQVGTYKGIYGFVKIPLFALDSIFRTYWFTKHIGIKHFKVCSQWVCYLFYKGAKYDRFKMWRSMSPDDLDDFLVNSNRWECTKKESD